MRGKACGGLRERKSVETTDDHLREALALGGAFTDRFLRCLPNLALGISQCRKHTGNGRIINRQIENRRQANLP